MNEWQRRQLLKRNTVRVKFKDLNPEVKQLIVRTQVNRIIRATKDMVILPTAGFAAYDLVKNPNLFPVEAAIIYGGVRWRHKYTKIVQEKHEDISQKMKKHGIMKTDSEKSYPQDWINPTIVAETHPIFTVQRNGDIIFRRVTRDEFLLLKRQEKVIGKAGANWWRWRGTLRRPEAPEVERKRFSQRLAALVERVRLPRLKPTFGPTRAFLRKPARRR